MVEGEVKVTLGIDTEELERLLSKGFPTGTGGAGAARGTEGKPSVVKGDPSLMASLKPLAILGGVGASVVGLVKSSQVISTYMGSFMQIFGAVVDTLLIPFIPLLDQILMAVLKLMPAAEKVAGAIEKGMPTSQGGQLGMLGAMGAAAFLPWGKGPLGKLPGGLGKAGMGGMGMRLGGLGIGAGGYFGGEAIREAMPGYGGQAVGGLAELGGMMGGGMMMAGPLGAAIGGIASIGLNIKRLIGGEYSKPKGIAEVTSPEEMFAGQPEKLARFYAMQRARETGQPIPGVAGQRPIEVKNEINITGVESSDDLVQQLTQALRQKELYQLVSQMETGGIR